MHILLSSEETLYQVSTREMSAKGRAEQVSAELYFKLKRTLPEKQFQEQAGYISTAAQAAFASLNKLDWIQSFYAEVNLAANTDTDISFELDSSSAGLGYALALALEWRQQLNKPTDYAVEVFATGEIHSSGAVTAIDHLVTKITGACNFMEKKHKATQELNNQTTDNQVTESQTQQPFIIFYPISNQDDVTPEIQTRVESLGGQLCPVERLQSALTTLLGDAYDGDAEGRWEPFKGLLSFNYEDNLRFFGRERALAKLSQEFTETEGLLVCTGVSGSGKSSLIKAGLIPHIHQHLAEGHTLNWLVSTPKTHGSVESLLVELLKVLDKHWFITNLIESEEDKVSNLDMLSKTVLQSPDTFIAAIQQAQLTQPNKRILYYVDQFEELFSHQEINREQAQQLAPLLTQLAKQIPNLDIVISIRSEYEDILGKYGNVSHVNPELNTSEWGDIVYKQATSFGLRYEKELEKRIVDEATSIQHALPALEYLLEQLYKKAKQADENTKTLTHAHYEQLNGIKGVIAARAEEVIAKHPMQAHAFFEYFVGLNNEDKPYAKSVNTDDIKKENEALYDLIQSFVDAQLVVDCSTETERRVKLAHDTLLNFNNEDAAWAALKAWFEENQAYLTWLNTISGNLNRWLTLETKQEDSTTNKKDNQSTAFLLNEHDLSTGQKFQQANRIQQPKVREYIAQSQQQKETLLKQKNKKQRLVILLVSVFLLIAVGASFIAYQQQIAANKAKVETQKTLTESNHNYATALNYKAQTYIKNKDVTKASLFLMKSRLLAKNNHDLPYSLFIDDLYLNENVISFFPNYDRKIRTKIAPNGLKVINNYIEEKIEVINYETGKKISFDNEFNFDVLVSQAIKKILLISENSVFLLNETTGKADKKYSYKSQIKVVFSTDGHFIVVCTFDKCDVIDISTWDIIYQFSEKKEKEVVAISFDNNNIAFSSKGSLYIHNIPKKETIKVPIRGVKGFIEKIEFSSNGNYLLATGILNIELFNLKLWQRHKLMEKLEGTRSHHASFSSSLEFVATENNQGVVEVWDLNKLKLVNSKEYDYVRDIIFSPKGRFLAVVHGRDVSLLTLDSLNTSIFSGGKSQVQSVEFFHQDRSMVTIYQNGIRRIWDLTSFVHRSNKTKLNNIIGDLLYSKDSQGLVFHTFKGRYFLDIATWQMYEFKCSLNKEGCLLDLKFENEVKKHKKPLLKIYQKNAYTSQQFTYSNDEKLILGIEKSEIYIYHIKSQQKDFIFNGVDELRVAEFFPGNSGVLFNRKDLLSLQYIDLKSDTARVFVGHENVVDAISVSPKGNKFASIDRGGVILFWDLEIGLEFKFQLQKEDVLFRYEDSLTIEFSPNGKQLAVKAAGSLYFITIDDIPNNKKLIHTFDNNANSLSGLKIEGMDIGRGKVLSKKMYEGLWSKYHHIYWKNKAEQNDPEALLQLGIVAQRDKKWDMAKLYYKKAKQAGHKNADYRFKINELMRKEYSSVLVK